MNKPIKRGELIKMIKSGADVRNVNVSQIRDLSGLFDCNAKFNQDIGGWDTSNVTDMHNMFYRAGLFNQDISRWDTSNVTDMRCMFYKSRLFNQNLSLWNVDRTKRMEHKHSFGGLSLSRANMPIWSEVQVLKET